LKNYTYLGVNENLRRRGSPQHRHVDVRVPFAAEVELVEKNQRRVLLVLGRPQSRDTAIFQQILI
jgi:hypothetical protein